MPDAALKISLIIAVVDRRQGERVTKILNYENMSFNFIFLGLDAARESGAGGGTILYARGAGNHEAERFLGFSFQPEKEIVLILAEQSQKQAIMKAVCRRCGAGTPGRGLSFALPVDGAAGLDPSSLHPLESESSEAPGKKPPEGGRKGG